MQHCFALFMLKEKTRALNFTRSCHERLGTSSLTFLLWSGFLCHKEACIMDCITSNRLLALLSWLRSGKIEPFTMNIMNACLEISKLLRTLKCAVIWTGFKMRHCTMVDLASSSPVFNLPFLQKVVWKGAASQT